MFTFVQVLRLIKDKAAKCKHKLSDAGLLLSEQIICNNNFANVSFIQLVHVLAGVTTENLS